MNTAVFERQQFGNSPNYLETLRNSYIRSKIPTTVEPAGYLAKVQEMIHQKTAFSVLTDKNCPSASSCGFFGCSWPRTLQSTGCMVDIRIR